MPLAFILCGLLVAAAPTPPLTVAPAPRPSAGPRAAALRQANAAREAADRTRAVLLNSYESAEQSFRRLAASADEMYILDVRVNEALLRAGLPVRPLRPSRAGEFLQQAEEARRKRDELLAPPKPLRGG